MVSKNIFEFVCNKMDIEHDYIQLNKSEYLYHNTYYLLLIKINIIQNKLFLRFS